MMNEKSNVFTWRRNKFMSLSNLLNQFMGRTAGQGNLVQGKSNDFGQTVSNLSSNIPERLVGGVAAGDLVVMLMSNKSDHKIAGKAASYGGTAMLGALALKAYQNWQGSRQTTTADIFSHPIARNPADFHYQAICQQKQQQPDAELILLKAIIAAARAGGRIDTREQQRIFKAVEQSSKSSEQKGIIFDYLHKDISLQEITSQVNSMELKTEVYLASCLVMDPEYPTQRAHLDSLSMALQLPAELTEHIEQQAYQVFAVAS
jgi:uncharacterized membrane protein YebE (DUF533 family)